jgi:hypothetical protein
VTDNNNIPTHLQKFLGGLGVVERDGGKPVSWGYPITAHMGEDRFKELRTYGRTVYIPPGSLNGKWYLVTRDLTPAEAEAQYGPISAQECGPQGGFRSITYGTTTFYTRRLRPLPSPKDALKTVQKSAPVKVRSKKAFRRADSSLTVPQHLHPFQILTTTGRGRTHLHTG